MFTDEKWKELRTLSGLPENARAEVEEIVRILSERPPHLPNQLLEETRKARKQIEQVGRSVSQALHDLGAIVRSDSIAYVHSATPTKENGISVIRRYNGEFTAAIEGLHAVQDALLHAHVPELRDRPGAKISHLRYVIESLNTLLLRKIERPLDRKKKKPTGIDLSEFVLKACREADPKIKLSTVLDHIKEVQALSRHTRGRPRK